MPLLTEDRYLRVRMVEPAGAYWRIYSPDTDHDVINTQFRNRYGVKPERIIECAGALWAGPIPEYPDTQEA